MSKADKMFEEWATCKNFEGLNQLEQNKGGMSVVYTRDDCIRDTEEHIEKVQKKMFDMMKSNMN